MCFSDLIKHLHREGINLTVQQVRWAVRTGAISRPQQDGSLRFVYSDQHVEELRELAKQRRPITRNVRKAG
jgi:hypothetical protein